MWLKFYFRVDSFLLFSLIVSFMGVFDPISKKFNSYFDDLFDTSSNLPDLSNIVFNSRVEEL